MIGKLEAADLGNRLLSFFDCFVIELFDPPTIQAHQMVVVRPFVEFEHRLACLEMIPMQQAGLLELGQYPVDRRQADIHAFGEQDSVDVFGSEMADPAVFEDIQNFYPRQRGFQAACLQVGRLIRHSFVSKNEILAQESELICDCR